MKNNVIRVIGIILVVGMFILMLFLTNDNIREKTNTGEFIPAIGLILIMFVCVIMICCKSIGKK